MEKKDLQLGMRVWAEVEQWDCNPAGYGSWIDVVCICKVCDLDGELDENDEPDDTIEVSFEYTDQAWRHHHETQRVKPEDIHEVVSITDLDYNDLRHLGCQIGFGSIYTSDYNNDLFVDPEEVQSYADEFLESVEESYGEDADKFCYADGFAEYMSA